MFDLPPVKYLDMAAKAAGIPDWAYAQTCTMAVRTSTIAHARTLEKLAQHEPEPVDADEAAVVRIFKEGLGPNCVIAGKALKRALAQYKAERPSLSDDEALLIAREICARVCSRSRIQDAYREGLYDNQERVQFALAMLKRDPAALEAFRGVGRG